MKLNPVPQPVLELLQHAAGETEWPEPEEITRELGQVDPFPAELLPEPLREWVLDSAHRMQCPIDFVAVGAMVSLSAVVGAGCAVRPKQEDDWHVVPNLWGGVVAEPGRLKTPALSDAMYPLNRLEAEAESEHSLAMSHFEFEKLQRQARREGIKEQLKKAAKSGQSNLDALKGEFIRSLEEKPPARKRHKTNDATVEKLGEILADNPRGVLLFRDELVGWLATLDEEDHQADRAFYLETWNGTGSHTWDRIGRGTVHVDNACIAVLGGIQPAKLQAYLYGAIHGLQNDGLLQRFQLLVYPDHPQSFQLVDCKPDQDARLRAYRVFDRLAKHDFAKLGAQVDEYCKQPYLRFDEEAQRAFNDWWVRLETEKIPGEAADIIKEHLSKYRSLLPSLALLIFLVERAEREHVASSAPARIPVGAVTQAIGWCEYLEKHARRIYRLGQDVRVQAAIALAHKIRKGDVKDGFSTRDVYRNGWSGLSDPEVVAVACRELEAAGWLRMQRRRSTGGRPAAPTYEINPRLRRGPAAEDAREPQARGHLKAVK